MANPMYRQIAEDLREQIESGRLAPGSQLPTELELRECYNASRNTVRDAIKWLTSLGLVATRPGQGTFVVDAIDPFVTTLSGDPKGGFGGGEGASYLAEVSQANRKSSTSPVQVEIQEASADIAASLWIVKGAEVISRHERHFIDGTPWSMQTSYYPAEFADRGAERLRAPATSAREPSSTWRTPCTSARSASAIGSPSAPRTRARRTSSSFPSTAGSRSTRSSGPRSRATGSRCA